MAKRQVTSEQLLATRVAQVAAHLAGARRKQVDSVQRAERGEIEATWQTWLPTIFPKFGLDKLGQPIPFAPHHVEFWDWVWSLRIGVRPRPLVAIWPRGHGKSTSAELACSALACRGIRSYGLYVCSTQQRADDHVSAVASQLESPAVARYYPTTSDRAVGKFGNVKGWRANRLRTAAGFTLDAIGLDTAARGAKIDYARPDFMVFDDLDGKSDTKLLTDEKIQSIVTDLIPAGAPDVAILAIQNLIIPDGIFARLAGDADWLADRIVSGPHPALVDLEYEEREDPTTGRTRYVILGGTPTWAGKDLDACQREVNDIGITAFKAEFQHEVEAPPGGLFDHLTFNHCRFDDVPPLWRVCCWVDPAVTSTDNSDCHGISIQGLGQDGVIYVLWSHEARMTPESSLTLAIRKAHEYGATKLGIETDQGGETWEVVYRAVAKAVKEQYQITAPQFTWAKAGSARARKAERASQMLSDYERGRIVHVQGTHAVLETALRRFPKTKPFDLVDASFWAWNDLRRVGNVRVVPAMVGVRRSPWSMPSQSQPLRPTRRWQPT